jgi:peptide deformylase
MEKLSILIWNDPRLSQLCEKLDDNEFGPQLEEFGRQLLEAMNGKSGIGLAAPQVGVLKRMFVMKFPDHEHMQSAVVCNPTIVLDGGTVLDREGCLSLPGLFEQVARASNATMQYRNPLGKMKELIIDKWDARVAQHEFDHLNGIMFFDYKDKRPVYGARMSKQMSKQLMRNWEKEKICREKLGL